MSRVRLAATLVVVLGGCGAQPAPPVAAPSAGHVARATTSRVVVVVMENKERDAALDPSSAPYVSRLARRSGQMTASYGVRHPSLPNYLALISGSTQGITDDCTDCQGHGATLADQLERAGRSWKAYMEGLPAPCSADVAGDGGYAKKHNPFAYFTAITGDPRRCGRIVGFDALAADLQAGRLPDFSFVSPNLCHDTHDCDVGQGDRFLRGMLPRLIRELGPHGFLVLTYDEGSSADGCCAGQAAGGRIATVVAGPDVRPGARSAMPVDHYGVLRTIENAFGLAHLGGAADRRNGTLRPLFRVSPTVRRAPRHATRTPAKPGAPTATALAFVDEFDGVKGSAPDAAKWVDYGPGCGAYAGWGRIRCGVNEHLDGKGHLIIPATAAGGSALQTKGRFGFVYGTMSAWIRMPAQAGYWPGFWSLNGTQAGAQALTGEIDGTEVYSTWRGSTSNARVWNRGAHVWSIRKVRAGSHVDLSGGYHKYSVNVKPGKITFYLDNTEVGSVSKGSVPAPWAWGPDITRPNFLILDLAIGGAGQPAPTAAGAMLVDRVEVTTP